MVSQTLGKVLVAVWTLLVFDRCWLPAPDLVQLDQNARLHPRPDVAVGKGAARTKGAQVKLLER